MIRHNDYYGLFNNKIKFDKSIKDWWNDYNNNKKNKYDIIDDYNNNIKTIIDKIL